MKNKKQKQEKFRVLDQLWGALKDMWCKRAAFFKLLAVSAGFMYVIGTLQAVELSKYIPLTKAQLLGLDGAKEIIQRIMGGYKERQSLTAFGIGPILSLAYLFLLSVVTYLVYNSTLGTGKKAGYFDGYFSSWRPFQLMLFYLSFYTAWVMFIGFIVSNGLEYLLLVFFIVFERGPKGLPLGAASLYVLTWIFLFWLVLRLLFVPLNICLGRGVASFRDAWHQTRGKFWQAFLTLLGLLIISLPLYGLNQVLPPPPLSAELFYLYALFYLAITLFVWVWGVTFFSRVWRGLSSKKS